MTTTAAQDRPRKINGLACEVCISERAYKDNAESINACRQEVADIRQQRDECHGSREQLKALVSDKGVQLNALRMERDDLRLDLARANERPSWWTVVGVGAGVAVVSGAIVFLVTALR